MLPPLAAGHLRRDARWRPGQRLKNDALFHGASVALAIAGALPLRRLRGLGRLLGLFSHAAFGRARKTALANVERVFPELGPDERRALVRRCFATMGEALGETVALFRPGDAPDMLPLAPEARATLAEARAEGRGVLFASAHLGPWEGVARSLVHAGVPLIALARESYDPRFTAMHDRLHRRWGVDVIWRARPSAGRLMLRALRRGYVLGIPMDLRSRVPSCDSPFLGHVAPTPVGPARLALRTGAAVVVGTAAPAATAETTKQGTLVITACRIATADLSAGASGAAELTHRINAELSRRIRAMPHAWVWMHPRWTDAGHL